MTRCARARVLCRFSHARLFATLWTVAHQASLSQALLTFDGSVLLCCHTWAAICCHFTSYTPQSPSALLSSAQTCPSPAVTPKAPSLNNWKKLVYDPYICTSPDYPCSLSSSQEIILRLTTFLITLLWMHPGLATFFLKMDLGTEYRILCSTNTCWKLHICQGLVRALETETYPPGLGPSPAEETVIRKILSTQNHVLSDKGT